MTTKEEEHALDLVAEDWSIFPDGNEYSPTLVSQETLLHEICHGLVFGMRLNSKVSARVSNRFFVINADAPILGLTYEAKTFAVERVALRLLGWSRRVNLKGLLKNVWQTGYSGRCLPLKMFLKLVQRFDNDGNTSELGVKAVKKMLQLARRKIRDERSVVKKAGRSARRPRRNSPRVENRGQRDAPR